MKSSAENQNQLIISYLTLRKMLGILGLLLPLIVMFGVFIFGQCFKIEATVSQYYYTIMGDVFVGLLFAISIFLITYKGYDRLDNIVTNSAGIFAICIALFPARVDLNAGCSVIDFPGSELSNALHLITASMFFLTLAFISLFLFTKSKAEMTKKKKTRNKIYKTCGVIIVICVALIAVYLSDVLNITLENYKPVFILESVALIAFGVSWLIKGEMFLED